MEFSVVLIKILLLHVTITSLVLSELNETMCLKLHNQIKIAEGETDFGQTRTIHRHNCTHDYIFSDVFLKLSRFASQLHLNGKSGQFLNLDLREYSQCIRAYLNSVCTPNSVVKCNPVQQFRSVNGLCNNLRAPKDGASGTSYSSMLFPKYDDGVSDIQRSASRPQDLPSPRLLTNKFFNEFANITEIYENGPTQGCVMFGQVIAHDISMGAGPAGLSSGSTRKCCKPDSSESFSKEEQDEYCAAIIAPPDDHIHMHSKRFCFDVNRLKNVYDNDCNLSARKPMNFQTASPDLSIIYGPTNNQSRRVRIFKSGLLFDNDKRNFPSFDGRATQTPQLAILHSLFIREHNRLAILIAHAKPKWSDEKLFQIVRSLVVAKYQHIIYNEWIPIFMDPKFIRLRFSPCTKHSVSSTVEFAHCMFRHQHTFLPPTFQLFDDADEMSMEISLSDNIGRTDLLDDFYDEVARGLYIQPTNFNGFLDEILNRLFKDETDIGIDLLALDIQRARETGVQGYTSYATVCLGKTIKNFQDLAPEISSPNIEKLQFMYSSVHDVDLYIAAKLEIVKEKFRFGPTLSCIIGDQLARYKLCDRYFYNNPNHPNPFTPEQLNEFQKASFARILCDNTNIKRVSRNAFRTAHEFVNCKKIPKVKIFLL